MDRSCLQSQCAVLVVKRHTRASLVSTGRPLRVERVFIHSEQYRGPVVVSYRSSNIKFVKPRVTASWLSSVYVRVHQLALELNEFQKHLPLLNPIQFACEFQSRVTFSNSIKIVLL
jgi:hypothetical protein